VLFRQSRPNNWLHKDSGQKAALTCEPELCGFKYLMRKETKMITTYFRPSIHGWPFGNSWRKSFVFDAVTLDMGFCGGMCWRALQRFYNAIPIDRTLPQPPQGDALYNELWDAQVNSVPASTLWKIFRWQESPDQGHWNRKHSQGHMTQQEWPSVKARLDKSEPVTLTLIAHANDVNLTALSDSHRVVAYAYEQRAIIEGEGEPSGADSHVTISIYDPNYENDDEVCLTFFLGGKNSNIRLRHNRGDTFHGFFLDDKDRSYSFADNTMVQINKCEQTRISSASLASYDLEFSWQCRFIPYFCIQVDGQNWKYNDAASQAKSMFNPLNFDKKQCSVRTGSITVNLNVPRSLSTLTVRLCDSDYYERSVEVDALPAFNCFPYVHYRIGDGPQVHDSSITDQDLFIKDPQPAQATVEQHDTSLFRWVINSHAPVSAPTRGGNLNTTYIQTFDKYRLGNIIVPIFANFVERNLAPPIKTSGSLKINHGQTTVQTINFPSLSMAAQKVFDGFTNNPFDYDNDTIVEFTFKAVDAFNREAEGKALFYGQSIICDHYCASISVFDPDKIGKLEAAARYLIERGLIDIIPELPQIPGIGNTPIPHRPQTRPTDPIVSLNKLRADRQLRPLIDQTLKTMWSKLDIWKEVWKTQSEILKQVDQEMMIDTSKVDKYSGILKAIKKINEADQQKFDGAITYTFAQKTIEQLIKNPTVIDKLKSL